MIKQAGLATVNGQRFALSKKNGAYYVDGARIVTTDIKCSNGVIHVIDSVIMPSSKSLVTTAVEAGSFKTLAAALKAAGLVAALEGKGPFTVFAPTDAAFAKLPKGTVASLLKPENKAKLTAILTYHVVAGRAFSEAVVKTDSVKTLQGRKVRVSVRDGSVFVNNAKVVATDINASNGVIHVIDSVLMPPQSTAKNMPARKQTMDIVDTAVAAGNFKTLCHRSDQGWSCRHASRARGLSPSLRRPTKPLPRFRLTR